MSAVNEDRGSRKTREGIVVSDKMDRPSLLKFQIA